MISLQDKKRYCLPLRRKRATVTWCLAAVAFFLIASWSVSPSSIRNRQILPCGQASCATVPMLNAWTIWWNSDRLAHGLDGYWNAPIFYPETGAFAFSEPQPATWIVAPVVWWTGSPVPAYHAYMVLMLTLNGLFALRLLRTLRVGWIASLAGSVAVLLHPLVHLQMDVLQLMPLWGVLWTVDVLCRLHRVPTWARGVELGVAFSCEYFTSIHHGLFFALLLLGTGWILVPWRTWKKWLAPAATGLLVAAVLLIPMLWPMHRILQSHRFHRRAETVTSLSATASDWLHVPPTALIPLMRNSAGNRHSLSPGWGRIAFAVVALGFGLRRRRRARIFLASFAGLALLLSFGMNIQPGDWRPWETLSHIVPGIAQVRSVYRFAYFAQLAILVLAALGVDTMCKWWVRRSAPGLWRRGGLAAMCLVGMLVAVEVPPAGVKLVGVPDVATVQAWQTYLANHASDSHAVVCLPFADGYSQVELDIAARWMLRGIAHGRPLVNGYSGFFPQSWFDLTKALREDPFSDESLTMLAACRAEYVVIQTDRVRDKPPAGDASSEIELSLVFRDECGYDVYRLDYR